MNSEKPQRKKAWIAWGLICLLGISSLVAVSGYASAHFYNERITCLFCAIIPLYYLLCKKSYKGNTLLYITFILVALAELILIIFNYQKVTQLTNFITLFGIFFFYDIFSKIPYERLNLYRLGLILSCMALVCIFLLLPGRLLAGWNENSSICLLPALLAGGSFLIVSEHSGSKFAFLVTQGIGLALTLTLANRAAFLAVLLFDLLVMTRLYLKRWLCLLMYLSVALLNIGLPVFHGAIANGYLFLSLSRILREHFGKSALNGREDLWTNAMYYIAKQPWFGHQGLRGVYYHNFSLDVLLQFGAIAWIVWIAVLTYLVFQKTRSNYLSNIFIVGFSSLLFLNTFENVLLANGYFLIFPYLFLAVPLIKNTPLHVRH